MAYAAPLSTLVTNPLQGGYGAGGDTAHPARSQGAQADRSYGYAMQAFGGQSGFDNRSAFAMGYGAPAAAAAGYGGIGGAQGALSGDLMGALQGVIQALVSVVESLAGLLQSMGLGQAGPGAGGPGAGANGGGLGGGVGGGVGPGAGANGGIGGNGNGGIVPPGVGGGYGPGAPIGQPASTIPTNVNYGDLNAQQRNQMTGMDERQRAVLHLWGIQMGSAGKQDGGVYLNVLQNPSGFKPAEVQLARELMAQEQAQFGGITGKGLDAQYFQLYQQISGVDISQRYGNAPINFATGPVNMGNRQSGGNGLSNFENSVLQLWGHNPLFTGGKVDGSILDYALNSPNRLEANLNNADLIGLKQADLASDGVLNGDSLEKSMMAVMDRVYLGGPTATMQGTMNDALAEAADRRAGLLPPPAAPAAEPINPLALGAVQKKGAGCPFLGAGV